ncbi:superoxide dismutase [Candidatus Woesearchaeota archaeon]|nr:superoxide dismutase [Candidatus Woesearchaeota archaeon]
MAKHELPALGYAYSALEPYIDEQTMKIHHTKHHQTYIDKLNAALADHKNLQTKTVEELLMDLDKVPESIRTAVRNHGGGHANHTFFWQIMAPHAGGDPSGKVADAIKKTFESFEKFKESFTNTGIARFGSGWAWLVVNNGKLEVYSTANQDSPLMEGKIPILGVDVWEHGYYLLYQWNRAEYLKNWWHVVNWRQVEENYKKAKQSS